MTAGPLSAPRPVLVIGATGYIGRFVADASLESGQTTYLLIRPGSGSCSREATIRDLRSKGAIIIEGCVEDSELIEKKLREHKIEVVISVTGGDNVLDQLCLVKAIRSAGTVKRFLPSEFGHDIDKANPVEPGLSFYNQKRKIRRAIEAAGIPYSYICCNSIAGWPYFDNTHPSEIAPPSDEFLIYGDGSVKAYFVAGTDIGKFTMKAAFDSRTLNKIVHFRPPFNCVTMNEMAILWESKLGRSLPRVTLTEKELLSMAEENCFPKSVVAALTHDIFINGCQTNYSIDGCKDVEVSSLYPDSTFQNLDEFFDEYAVETPLQEVIELCPPNSMKEMLPVPPTCA
ncbi:putative leucoanthocyanidin reductase [Iris pallida]|uniref:Leucoanthocyanidin reductase n=1 Tax=Iris pallida TaxID=29817 RepID=A0AAX6I1H4_IRIPA|nr:putative leucoanthocyanidin reductase [Iris pallida]